MIKRIINISVAEMGHIMRTPIYWFSMIIFPIIIIIFFTLLLYEGQPKDLPCGVVDNDNTSVTRSMVRTLNSFQGTDITNRYNTVTEARKAIQRDEIYAFLYIPKNTTVKLLTNRQPKISFYYSNISIMAGTMLFKDLKLVTTLSSAAVAQSKLMMIGKTEEEIKNFIQPININMHTIGNPLLNYNSYLTTFIVPGIFILFILTVTAYSLGTEIKFNHAKKWMNMANNNIYIALAGKLFPHFLIFFTIFICFDLYIYGYLNFPHNGNIFNIVLLSFLTVISSQGLAVFFFGLVPSLRMSMSICSLWAMIGFSICGATFPVFAMDKILEVASNLFPLRHYYMIYQMNIFNNYPLFYSKFHLFSLVIFILLPILCVWNIKKAMTQYVYIP